MVLKNLLITLAAITLHNWLRSDSSVGKICFQFGIVDHKNIDTGEVFEGSWISEPITSTWHLLSNPRCGNSSSNQAVAVREE